MVVIYVLFVRSPWMVAKLVTILSIALLVLTQLTCLMLITLVLFVLCWWIIVALAQVAMFAQLVSMILSSSTRLINAKLVRVIWQVVWLAQVIRFVSPVSMILMVWMLVIFVRFVRFPCQGVRNVIIILIAQLAVTQLMRLFPTWLVFYVLFCLLLIVIRCAITCSWSLCLCWSKSINSIPNKTWFIFDTTSAFIAY